MGDECIVDPVIENTFKTARTAPTKIALIHRSFLILVILLKIGSGRVGDTSNATIVAGTTLLGTARTHVHLLEIVVSHLPRLLLAQAKLLCALHASPLFGGFARASARLHLTLSIRAGETAACLKGIGVFTDADDMQETGLHLLWLTQLLTQVARLPIPPHHQPILNGGLAAKVVAVEVTGNLGLEVANCFLVVLVSSLLLLLPLRAQLSDLLWAQACSSLILMVLKGPCSQLRARCCVLEILRHVPKNPL